MLQNFFQGENEAEKQVEEDVDKSHWGELESESSEEESSESEEEEDEDKRKCLFFTTKFLFSRPNSYLTLSL